MRLDWDVLQQVRAEGFLAIVPHPDPAVRLFLLNYTARAQYQQAWDRYPVLLDCRGTVVNEDGEVVAKSFSKFFNVAERPETRLEHLATLGAPEVTPKLDGSMCLQFPEGDGYALATRGSFTSAQARRATAIWRERYAASLADRLDPRLTYVFELVGPQNRIVVRYEREELILIGLVVTETGREQSYAEVRREAQRLGLPHVEAEEPPEGGWLDWRVLLEEQRPNFEGFVLFWPAHQVRVKVKLAEYVRLHRIVSGLSEHLVWEYLRDGADLETLRALVPEESAPWLEATIARIARARAQLDADVERVLALVRASGHDPADRGGRKAVAELVLRESGDARPAVFRALDGKPYGDILWKLVEPAGVEPIRAVAEESA